MLTHNELRIAYVQNYHILNLEAQDTKHDELDIHLTYSFTW